MEPGKKFSWAHPRIKLGQVLPSQRVMRKVVSGEIKVYEEKRGINLTTG